MTRDDDFIGQLEGYLDEYEGPTPLPDAIRNVVRAQLPEVRQVGPPSGPRRYLNMNRPLKVAGAGLVLVAAAALGIGLYRSNVGVEPSPQPTTATPSPQLQPAGWSNTKNMNASRFLGTATLLSDGKVLVAGGRGSTNVGHALASVETYDPASGTWRSIASMLGARSSQTATLLADNRVLVAGGYDDWAALASAEIYDPATGSWTTTGNMAEARGYHTATLLPDGRVLVTGGRSNNSSTGSALDTVELYDPSTGRWTSTGSMGRGRAFHTATLLADGDVLVAGAGILGGLVDFTATAELFDPTTGRWKPTGSMTAARAYHTATLLENGTVLVVGGYDSIAQRFGAGEGAALASAELFDPATGTWSEAGDTSVRHAWHTATLLSDGRVLVVAGQAGERAAVGEGTSTYSTGIGLTSAEIYDPGTGSWTTTADLIAGRELHMAVLLADGQVLVAGGSTGGAPLSSAELYRTSAGS